MSLPPQYVDRIFARLLVRYGAAWLRMWDQIDMEAVKADWAEVLSGLPDWSLKHALDNLPERHPNAQQFRELCREARSNAPALTFSREKPPAPNVERLIEALDKLPHGADWAKRLRERVKQRRESA